MLHLSCTVNFNNAAWPEGVKVAALALSFFFPHIYIHTYKQNNQYYFRTLNYSERSVFVIVVFLFIFFLFRPAISNFHNLTIFPSRFYPSLWINTDTQLYRWIMQTVRRKSECTRIHNYGLLLRLFWSILFVARNAKNYSHTSIAENILFSRKTLYFVAGKPTEFIFRPQIPVFFPVGLLLLLLSITIHRRRRRR